MCIIVNVVHLSSSFPISNCLGVVMVEYSFMLGQTKDYRIGICCLSAKQAALRSSNKDCRGPPKIGKKYDFLAQNRDFSNEIPQKFSRLPPQLEKI